MSASSELEDRRVAFVGDTHGNEGNLRRVLNAVFERDVDTIFIAGDFGFWPNRPWGKGFLDNISNRAVELGIIIHWVDGNHEDHSAIPHDRDEAWEHHPNIIWHPRGEVFELKGRKVLSFGGAQSVDQNYQQSRGMWFRQEYPTEAQFQKALDAGKVDVLVTHEAPSELRLVGGIPQHLIPEQFLKASYNMRVAIRDIIYTTEPRLVVHGHWHYYLKTIEGDRVIYSLAHDGDAMERQVKIIDLEDWSEGQPVKDQRFGFTELWGFDQQVRAIEEYDRKKPWA